jgi:hypothetical protein
MLIFLHLPRTAGTTLAHILARQYGETALLRLYDSSSGEELSSMSTSQLEAVRVIMGHFSFGAHRFLQHESAYFTVLREPVSRVISHYSFVRRSPTHYLYETAQGLGLPEFVASCGLEEPNNDQTRMLAGEHRLTGSARSAERVLGAAKEHLRDHFAVTGLTEDFDRSILLMKRVFDWKAPYYARENVSRGRPSSQRLSSETLRVIAAHNQLDLALYQFARDIFAAQLQQHGGSLESELRSFRRMNSLRGRLYDLRRLPVLARQARNR